MFKFSRRRDGENSALPEVIRSPFGIKKITPRLESAFVFPAPQRPRGLSLDGAKRAERPLPKKC